MNLQNNRKHFNHLDLIQKIGDDKAFIEYLYTTFLEGFEKYIDKIKKAFSLKNQDMLKNNAHALKGSAYSACFEILGDMIFELEKMDVNQNEVFQKLIPEIEKEKLRVKEAMEEFLKNS
ncbi:MAG: Hpt domain-containing protein [Bacteroidales bacterium]|nr:Hpt domain-containing protein [Bacteroidales bacterium]